MDIFYQIMQKYPLMSSWSDKKYWTGFVSIQGVLVRLALKVPNFPLIHGGDLSGNTETQSICKSFTAQIEASMVGKELTLLEFLDSFVNLMMTNAELKKRSSSCMNTVDDQFYSTLMTELEQIGLDNTVYTSENYREIHLKHTDGSGREHIARYCLPTRYPHVALTVKAEIPSLTENFAWPCKIVEAHSRFTSQVEKFDGFWRVMDELDEKTRVVDPPRPNRTHTYRRIMVQDRVILHMEINPLNPRRLPEITFTGPEKVVESFESLLQNRCKNWNGDLSILTNLENILEIEFLEKPIEDIDVNDDSLKCTVCYMYELEGNAPERACECGAQYHHRCLYDLLVNEFSTTVKKYVECPVCGVELKMLVIPT